MIPNQFHNQNNFGTNVNQFNPNGITAQFGSIPFQAQPNNRFPNQNVANFNGFQSQIPQFGSNPTPVQINNGFPTQNGGNINVQTPQTQFGFNPTPVQINNGLPNQNGVNLNTQQPQTQLPTSVGNIQSGNTNLESNNLVPSNQINVVNNQISSNIMSAQSAQNFGQVNEHKTSMQEIDNKSVAEICGISMGATPLIVQGVRSARGSYPWHAALFKTTETGFEFICGGSLISDKHVLTGMIRFVKNLYRIEYCDDCNFEICYMWVC